MESQLIFGLMDQVELALQPILKKMGFFKNTRLPVAEYLSRNGLYLPTGLSITYLQQKFVINKIKEIVSKLNN